MNVLVHCIQDMYTGDFKNNGTVDTLCLSTSDWAVPIFQLIGDAVDTFLGYAQMLRVIMHHG